jgi:hypothetical protein
VRGDEFSQPVAPSKDGIRPEDVEELGARPTEGVEASPQLALELIRVHVSEVTRGDRCTNKDRCRR